jgi:hypothetical protein
VWFLGQALVGPLTLGLDQYHQNHLKVLGHMQNSSSLALVLRSANPDEMRDPDTGRAVITVPDSNGVPWAEINGKRYSPAWPPYVKSIARTNELGTLFTTIAGFLNVIVIIDAAWNRRIDRKRAAAPAAPRTLRVPGAGA